MPRPVSRLPAALLAATVAAGLAGCAGTAPDPVGTSSAASARSSASEQRIEVTVHGGTVTGDTGRVPVVAGSHVTLVVTSDVADEVHVHGYDVEQQLSPGGAVEIPFDATIPGVFEVELHDAGTTLLSLQVG